MGGPHTWWIDDSHAQLDREVLFLLTGWVGVSSEHVFEAGEFCSGYAVARFFVAGRRRRRRLRDTGAVVARAAEVLFAAD